MKLGYGRMLSDRLDGKHGLARTVLEELSGRFPAVQDELRSRHQLGEYGFLGLGDQTGTVGEIRRFADGVGQAFDHVLVLGIGGSALGTRALLSALKPHGWNELSDEAREYFPRLTVLENVDPVSVHGALGRIDPRRVLVNVVSKSGATAETLAQYLVVRHWLEAAVGPDAASHHMVFTTDPERGALRQIAARENIPALEVPPEIGGRFSVLSPVGLLPAALVGIDIEALLRGTRRALRRAESSRLLDNPAALYSALLWAADARQGARVHVLMPYSDRLRDFAEWYRQLWAESLGKRVNRFGEEVWTGPTPVSAVGATDQHSQVQLFMEGPYDKVVTFIRVEDHGIDVPIPARAGLPEDLAYLAGRSLGELLSAEQEATAAALSRSGRMNAIITLPKVDADVFGELLMFFQLATGYGGIWYGVDPFNQPGVELGKQLTFGAMGRAGYEAHRDASPADDSDTIQ